MIFFFVYFLFLYMIEYGSFLEYSDCRSIKMDRVLLNLFKNIFKVYIY